MERTGKRPAGGCRGGSGEQLIGLRKGGGVLALLPWPRPLAQTFGSVAAHRQAPWEGGVQAGDLAQAGESRGGSQDRPRTANLGEARAQSPSDRDKMEEAPPSLGTEAPRKIGGDMESFDSFQKSLFPPECLLLDFEIFKPTEKLKGPAIHPVWALRPDSPILDIGGFYVLSLSSPDRSCESRLRPRRLLAPRSSASADEALGPFPP